jgi:hypothetical protein
MRSIPSTRAPRRRNRSTARTCRRRADRSGVRRVYDQSAVVLPSDRAAAVVEETVHGAHPLPVPEVCPVTFEDLLGEDLGIEITDEDRKPKPSTKP